MADYAYVTKAPMTLKQFDAAIAKNGWKRQGKDAENQHDARNGIITGIAKVKTEDGANRVMFWAQPYHEVDSLVKAVDAAHEDTEEFQKIFGWDDEED